MGFMTAWFLMLAGCSYRMPAPTAPSEELIRLIAKAPQQYSLQVSTRAVNEHDVPPDGRLKISVPGYRRACGVYLFDAVKVGGYGDPLKAWNLTISRRGNVVRKLSLDALRSLATDEAGYRMLRVED